MKVRSPARQPTARIRQKPEIVSRSRRNEPQQFNGRCA
jgi:hypothetical protein